MLYKYPYLLCYIFIALIVYISGCQSSQKKQENSSNAKDSSQLKEAPEEAYAPNFTVSVKKAKKLPEKPHLQSFAYGRFKHYWLFIGGRKQGFHGTSDPDHEFPKKKANDSIWVVNSKTMESYGIPVPDDKPFRHQFISTNMQYTQVDNTLYLAGGYTTKTDQAKLSNHTSQRFTALNVPNMISYILNRHNVNIETSKQVKTWDRIVKYSLKNPVTQVTGGEMEYFGNYFYLALGQNYEGSYHPGKTGAYTREIRRFKIDNESITDIKRITYDQDSTVLHRRDLNVQPVMINSHPAMGIFGGVFTENGGGYGNPVFLQPHENEKLTVNKQFDQRFNNYNCASFSMLDGSLTHVVFMGGISAYRWSEQKQQFTKGDQRKGSAVPLPFVDLISVSSVHEKSKKVIESVQQPGKAPTLPELIGANAAFIPLPKYMDGRYDMLNAKVIPKGQGKVKVGYLFGGIHSTAPTTGRMNPTYVNKNLYEVFIKFE